MKTSAKMKKSIKRLTKKYGNLDITYFVEPNESVRIGGKFWDGAECYCRILQKNWTVNHNGEIY